MCPGFVSDCLETLEEIAIENKAAFLRAGGGEFHYIPCLNERDDWIRALTEIALGNLQGWVSHAWDAVLRQQGGGSESTTGAGTRSPLLTCGSRPDSAAREAIVRAACSRGLETTWPAPISTRAHSGDKTHAGTGT